MATGATATALFTGSANITTIIAVQGPIATSYAAGLARAYNGGGYTDWYLPSKDELNKLYLSKEAIGGFVYVCYWSSSESDAVNAWAQYFADGYQHRPEVPLVLRILLAVLALVALATMRAIWWHYC